jgi:hypothetical protein
MLNWGNHRAAHRERFLEKAQASLVGIIRDLEGRTQLNASRDRDSA